VDSAPTNVNFAPAPSTAIKATTKSAIFLEHHVGAVVAVCAGAIAEAALELRNGAITERTKTAGGDAIAELFKLRQFMIADWPDFDRIARKRGVEASVACDVPLAAANMLVDAVLEILAKIVRDKLN
jgi:hypothetical protein